MRARVLVVDDNVDMVQSMTALLGLGGFESRGCPFGTEAMHYVRDFDPDIVLLDIRMPGKSGWAVAEEIRKAKPGKRPVIVAISGEYARSNEPMPGGFDHFLRKPIDAEALLGFLKELRP
jgi:two-component system CheB/CheR fusion protein